MALNNYYHFLLQKHFWAKVKITGSTNVSDLFIGSDIVDWGGQVVFTLWPNKLFEQYFPEVQNVGTSQRHFSHSGWIIYTSFSILDFV